MKRNHYGCTVDSEKPVVGVVTNHQPEFLMEDISSNGINIDLGEYLSHCESDEDREAVHETWESETIIVGFKEWDFKTHFSNPDMTTEDVMQFLTEFQPWAIVIGDKIFVPDEAWEYQAVVGEVYTQVLKSKFVQRASLCFPSYPGQADLGTPGDFLAYTLPGVVWGNRMEWRILNTTKNAEACAHREEELESLADMIITVDKVLEETGKMPDSAFRSLNDDKECLFREWARKNYILGGEIKGVWHPAIRDECEKMNAEVH